MPKPYFFTPQARLDLQEVIDNVVEYTSHRSTGEKLHNEILSKLQLISQFPQAGKAQINGTREIFARSYRIVYREKAEHIEIITIIHARRLYPRLQN